MPNDGNVFISEKLYGLPRSNFLSRLHPSGRGRFNSKTMLGEKVCRLLQQIRPSPSHGLRVVVMAGGTRPVSSIDPRTKRCWAHDRPDMVVLWSAKIHSAIMRPPFPGDRRDAYTWDARNRLAAFGSTRLRTIHLAGGRGTPRKAFLYDGVNAVQELSGSTVTANLLTGLGVDEIFTRTDSAGARYFLPDALGSTLALTDSNGAVQTQYSYEPFGKTTTTGASNSSTFQYTGRENDGTGLYYYRARYYHPTLQRFISEDPLGFSGGDANLYGYVWNSPTNFIDPLGEAGFGVSLGGSVEGGGGYAGAGATGSVGLGIFFDGWRPSSGGFGSGGAFAGGPPAAKDGPGWGAAAPSCPNDNNWAAGLFAGGGANVFATNANNVADLSGPFKTWSLNVGWGARVLSIQFSRGQNAAGRTIYFGSYGGPPLPGVGYGASVSSYNTNTATTSGRGYGCN